MRKGKEKLNPLTCKRVTEKVLIIYFQISCSSVLSLILFFSEELSVLVDFTSHVIKRLQVRHNTTLLFICFMHEH